MQGICFKIHYELDTNYQVWLYSDKLDTIGDGEIQTMDLLAQVGEGFF